MILHSTAHTLYYIFDYSEPRNIKYTTWIGYWEKGCAARTQMWNLELSKLERRIGNIALFKFSYQDNQKWRWFHLSFSIFISKSCKFQSGRMEIEEFISEWSEWVLISNRMIIYQIIISLQSYFESKKWLNEENQATIPL